MQTVTTTQAVDINGALAIILLGIGAAVPIVFNSVIIPLGKGLVTRFNTNNSQKLEELDAFKFVKDQLKSLQEKNDNNDKEIVSMQKQILELQQKIFLMEQAALTDKAEIARLQRELDDCVKKAVA
jgi:peptidoglycan hydrolase CwlO-like protein